MSSIWYKTAKLPKFPSLDGERKTDVLIIGGGIAGILTAYMLNAAGVSYILAEKDEICGGTTGGTTGKITFQHGLIYSRLLKTAGSDAAQMYLCANRQAFSDYIKLCGDIDCDFEFKDNYVYSVSDRKKLEDEMSALDRIGYSAKLCENPPIPINTAGAVCFPKQAQFNPLKFLAHTAKDLNICEHTHITELRGTTAVCTGGKITADKIVVTTHFPFINKHGFYFMKLYQHRTYMTALENAPDTAGMYVDENNCGMTFRNYKDKLILGGFSHRTGKDICGWSRLEEFAKKNYPDSSEVCRWAAQDCISLDGMPYIGRYSAKTADLYTACGFNKWGMTGAMLAANMICDAVLGRQNEYAELFSPSGRIFKPQLLVNSFEAAKNLLTISSKRCPHMGCALKWNKHEHSWDCPCHGSRFTEKGRVLENPANGDLN